MVPVLYSESPLLEDCQEDSLHKCSHRSKEKEQYHTILQLVTTSRGTTELLVFIKLENNGLKWLLVF